MFEKMDLRAVPDIVWDDDLGEYRHARNGEKPVFLAIYDGRKYRTPEELLAVLTVSEGTESGAADLEGAAMTAGYVMAGLDTAFAALIEQPRG